MSAAQLLWVNIDMAKSGAEYVHGILDLVEKLVNIVIVAEYFVILLPVQDL